MEIYLSHFSFSCGLSPVDQWNKQTDSPTNTQTFNEVLNQQIKLSLWGNNYAPATDDFLQIPADQTVYPAQNPEISVTNVLGDEVKLVLTEQMEEGWRWNIVTL